MVAAAAQFLLTGQMVNWTVAWRTAALDTAATESLLLWRGVQYQTPDAKGIECRYCLTLDILGFFGQYLKSIEYQYPALADTC